MTTRTLHSTHAPVSILRGGRSVVSTGSLLSSPSAWASFLAAFLAEFTVPLIGEMPVGEFVLMAAGAWAGLCLIFNRAWPGPLLRSGLLRWFLAAQAVAFCAYVVSDLYWQSSPEDMARGWGRMIFLAIDIIAIAYLFGCDRRNVIVFLAGQCLGAVTGALLAGPMFGDMWKFGVGEPLTYLALFVSSCAGPVGTLAAAGAMAFANFTFDYRSLGGLCIAVAALVTLQGFRPRWRPWLAPFVAAASIAAVLAIADRAPAGQRATRSDIERSAMITAAAEAFEQRPLIGNGSWFGKSDVYDNFLIIRHNAAAAAHVGGFADANTDPGAVAIHSQILVALAEGGLFGGAFFFVYGAALLRALFDIAIVQHWRRLDAVYLLILLTALWDLLLSPFSGVHRVSIAMACGLILVLREDRLAGVGGRILNP